MKNWAENHLNWSVVFVWFFTGAVAVGLFIIMSVLDFGMGALFIIISIVYFVAPVWLLWFSSWIIRKKARNQLWLLAVIAFGFFVLLLLNNRNKDMAE